MTDVILFFTRKLKMKWLTEITRNFTALLLWQSLTLIELSRIFSLDTQGVAMTPTFFKDRQYILSWKIFKFLTVISII